MPGPSRFSNGQFDGVNIGPILPNRNVVPQVAVDAGQIPQPAQPDLEADAYEGEPMYADQQDAMDLEYEFGVINFF